MTAFKPVTDAFFDEATNTVTYLISDPATGAAVLVDPVLEFTANDASLSTRSVDHILKLVQERGLQLERVLDTHAHADHLSAADYVRAATGARYGIGARISEVQKAFLPIFAASDVTPDGRIFDDLFKDGDRLAFGGGEIEVLHTPGHTPACVTYKIGDALYVGDTLFMPDYGTARTDFPGGDAATLYQSIRRLLDFPGETRIFVGHDYKSATRSGFAWETTVQAQRADNLHVRDGISESDFVAMRTARDAGLGAPALLLPSLQVNIRGGKLPPADPSGHVFLRLPVTWKPHSSDVKAA